MDIRRDQALLDMTEDTETTSMTAPRTAEGLLAAVSSEVRQAFLQIKKTVVEPEVVKIFDLPSPLPPGEPLVRFDIDREQRRDSLKKARQKNSYELITTHLLRALHNEARKGHPSRKESTILSQREKASVVNPTIHAPKKRRNTRVRHSFLSKASKDRHYYYRKHHRPTPAFVRHLASKHRIGTDVDVERLSESPEPQTRQSPEVESQVQHKTSTQQKPYTMTKSASLKEIGEFVKKNRQLQRVTLPALGSNKIQTELIHLGDKQFKVPVLNFDQRAVVQRFKAARNNPAFLSGIRVENYEPVENVVSIDVPRQGLPVFTESQYLITARRDRRMQVNRKLSMITRNRNLNRKETRLAVGKKKVHDVQVLIAAREAEMDAIAQQSNETTVQCETLLRESDQLTIDAIHQADVMKANSTDMSKLLMELQADNNLLLCLSLRRQEQIHLVDRFINVVYRVIPEYVKTELLKSYYQKHSRPPLDKKADYPADLKLVRDILHVYKSLSEESRMEYPSDSDDSEAEAQERIPPLLFSKTDDIFPYLEKLHEESVEACEVMGELKYESRGLQARIGLEGNSAVEYNKLMEQECQKIQEEIESLKENIALLRADNARYETGEFCRDTMRRPTNVLREQIFRYFRRNFDHPEESVKKMLEQMHNCVQNTIERFRNVPTPVVHKCFKAAEKDKAFEAEVARQMDFRNEHDQRSQKLFYKSLNPPEIIWGQPVTIADIPDVVAETVKQMESQAMVNRGSTWIMKDEEATDTETWLQHRLENISELELEFEGSPSRILNLNEGTSEILSQAVHSMFAHKIPYLHSSSSNVNLMTPSQARLVQEIIEDVGTILVNEEAHNMAFQSKEFLPSTTVNLEPVSSVPVTQIRGSSENVSNQAARLAGNEDGLEVSQESTQVHLSASTVLKLPEPTAAQLARDQRIKDFFANFNTLIGSDAVEEPTKVAVEDKPDDKADTPKDTMLTKHSDHSSISSRSSEARKGHAKNSRKSRS